MNKYFIISVLLIFSFVFFGTDKLVAQVPPSDTLSKNPPISIPLTKAKKEKKISKKPLGPVILDVRPFFEYTLNHYEHSQPIRWEDYSQNEDPFKGLLDPDLNHLATKLRALGIAPGREVIILGKGQKGFGEEGRIAWMLEYMGLSKIKMMNYDSFNGRKNSEAFKEEWAAPVWIPKPNEKIRIRKSELRKLNTGESGQNYVIVDTRSKEEYEKAHIEGAKHLEWKNFVNKDGNPISTEEVKKLLSENEIDLNAEIIYYCTAGIRSGYTTFLTTLAGLKARHFDGGFEEWQSP